MNGGNSRGADDDDSRVKNRVEERVAVIVLKDSAEYRDWLREVATRSYMSVATVVRVALAEFAARHGCPPPPNSYPSRAPRSTGTRAAEEEVDEVARLSSVPPSMAVPYLDAESRR